MNFTTILVSIIGWEQKKLKFYIIKYQCWEKLNTKLIENPCKF